MKHKSFLLVVLFCIPLMVGLIVAGCAPAVPVSPTVAGPAPTNTLTPSGRLLPAQVAKAGFTYQPVEGFEIADQNTTLSLKNSKDKVYFILSQIDTKNDLTLPEALSLYVNMTPITTTSITKVYSTTLAGHEAIAMAIDQGYPQFKGDASAQVVMTFSDEKQLFFAVGFASGIDWQEWEKKWKGLFEEVLASVSFPPAP